MPFVREIDERFMSFQIGFSHLTGGETWKSYDALPDGSKAAGQGGFAAIREARSPTDLSAPRLRVLTRALAPLYIRYSGTTANSVYFHDSDTPLPAKVPDGFTVMLSRAAWKGAVDFAKAVDAKILTSFANSAGVRDPSGAWTPAMAKPWLAYTRAIGGEIYAAELFNEPNAPEPPRIPHGHSPEEFGRDFAAFRSFMSQAAPGVKLAGPGNAVLGVPVPIASLDSITPEQYAQSSPTPRFDIVSYHFYPALAERCASAEAPEPPRIPHGHSPEEFGRDFAAFRSFMSQAAPGVKLAGPGNAVLGVPVPVASLDGITPEHYAASSPAPRFDIVSYHFYPALAERCASAKAPEGIGVDQALSEDWLARPDRQAQRFKALRDRHAPGAPIWLTETGGAACGGLRWQPAFLDTFRFLDTHARLAKQGVDAVFTHALISGSNGIIDEKTLQPNASYWAALVWRQLMGTRVLDAGTLWPGLHVYAHCQRNTPGGVTLLALNLEAEPAILELSGPAELYALTAPDLQSRNVLLNGKPLELGAGDVLPALTPVRLGGRRASLAPTSANFITLANAANPHCQER